MTKKNRNPSFMPGYVQVRQHVYDMAASAQEGAELLTTEKELCELFGMARGTIRKALQTLVDEGLLIRRPHHGTFVNPDMIASMPHRPCIGIVIGDGECSFLNDYYMNQLQGAFDGAINSGFHTRLLQFNGEPERVLSRFKHSGAKGIAWTGITDAKKHLLDALPQLELPVVLSMSMIDTPGCDCVEIDYLDYGLSLGRTMLGNGLHRILFLDNNPPGKVHLKREGLTKAFAEAGIPWDETLYIPCKVQGSGALLEQLLATGTAIDAVHAPEAFEHMLTPALLRHPEIQSIFPRSTKTSAGKEGIAIHVPTRETAKEAMTLLLRRLTGMEKSEAPVKIETKVEITYNR